MRNLIKYPVTIDEIVKCLDELSEQLLNEEAIGDMRPLLLKMAAKIVSNGKIPDEYEEIRDTGESGMQLTDKNARDVGSFDLCGIRLSDGTLKLFGSNTIMDDWPEEVELFGVTYSLERKQIGNSYEDGIFESAMYA